MQSARTLSGAVPAAFAALALILSAPGLAQEGVQTTTGATSDIVDRSVDKKGLGLSGTQTAMIEQLTRSEKKQASPAERPLVIGVPIPDSMTLIELPIEVKDQIGTLRDFKFARLQDDTVLLVDPTTRVVVDVVHK